MNLPPYLLKPLSRFYKRELDPARAAKIYAEYDERRGYSHYSDVCQAALERDVPELPEDSLGVAGFTYLNLIKPDKAQALIKDIQQGKELSTIKKDANDLMGYRLTDREEIKAVLSSLITPEADSLFLHYFRSEYLVHTVTFTITPKAEEQDSVSFRWHCDKGPRKHLKMIVYLNSSSEHGGNTEFIDLNDTASVAEKGYLFGWSQQRTGDIQRLEEIAGQSLQSHIKSMNQGEAVIFQPASVLHRGISPCQGNRFVITLCLLPSPVPWQEAFANNALTDLAVSEKWHTHADELLQQFSNLPMQ